MAAIRLQALGHLGQHRIEGLDRDLTLVVIQDLNETRHVRALEVMGQVYIHIEVGDGVLFTLAAVFDADRVTDVLDAYFVDRDATGVGAALDIFHGCVLGHCLTFSVGNAGALGFPNGDGADADKLTVELFG